MCKDCLRSRMPDRGSLCVDSGAYVLNYKGCAECQSVELKQDARKEETDEDGEETITYTHKCASCDHTVARHSHTFSVEDAYQTYSMECMLCGHGDDQRSVMPYDPAKARRGIF